MWTWTVRAQPRVNFFIVTRKNIKQLRWYERTRRRKKKKPKELCQLIYSALNFVNWSDSVRRPVADIASRHRRLFHFYHVAMSFFGIFGWENYSPDAANANETHKIQVKHFLCNWSIFTPLRFRFLFLLGLCVEEFMFVGAWNLWLHTHTHTIRKFLW